MNIKTGDLVMVVKPTPCCGNNTGVGVIGAVSKLKFVRGRCKFCGQKDQKMLVYLENGKSVLKNRVKKIDPPADGDSLPTRKDIEVAA